MVNAWANHVNFCLGQVNVDSEANEIPAVRELLGTQGFEEVCSRTDLAGIERCSGGRWPGLR